MTSETQPTDMYERARATATLVLVVVPKAYGPPVRRVGGLIAVRRELGGAAFGFVVCSGAPCASDIVHVSLKDKSFTNRFRFVGERIGIVIRAGPGGWLADTRTVCNASGSSTLLSTVRRIETDSLIRVRTS